MAVPPPSAAGQLALPCDPAEVDEFLSRPRAEVAAVLARTPGPFLVLGAGGKIGLHLCRMLRSTLDRIGRNDAVVAVSRFHTLRGRAEFERAGIAVRPCDLHDPGALAGLPDSPTVFFLAGVKFGTATDPGLLHALNVELPRRVATRFCESRIVAFSSGCVYPFVTPESGGATELTPLEAVGDYAASCIAREQAFAEVSVWHHTPVALLRLNYSVEFRYGLLLDIAERVWRGRPVNVTMGSVNAIWQSDTVAHSIQALEVAGSPPVPINLTGPQILSVRELAHRFGALFDRPVRIAGQEAPTAWLNNAGRSHRLFGPPSVSSDEMTAWIAAWLQAGGETWGKPTGFERRDGRY